MISCIDIFCTTFVCCYCNQHIQTCDGTIQVIGLCLTASHNAEEDNGIKISDPDGGVIDMKWFAIHQPQIDHTAIEIGLLLLSAHKYNTQSPQRTVL